jgi:hypothetical protein
MHTSDFSVRRLGLATALWGIVFAGFHFYWAAGGAAGMNEASPTLGESLYIAFIAVLGLAGAAVAYGLYRPWGAHIGRRPLRLLARFGGLILLLGVAFGAGRWIADGSLGDDGAAGVVITAYFFLGGLLFSALGWLRLAAQPAAAARTAASSALTEGRPASAVRVAAKIVR